MRLDESLVDRKISIPRFGIYIIISQVCDNKVFYRGYKKGGTLPQVFSKVVFVGGFLKETFDTRVCRAILQQINSVPINIKHQWKGDN